MPMNPAVKEMWVTALRSGKYTQGQCNLKVTNDGTTKHCCLGVLGDIAVVVGIATETIITDCNCGNPDHTHKKSTYGEHNTSYLPFNIEEWAGITRDDQGTFINMNDGQGASFADIADFIELNF